MLTFKAFFLLITFTFAQSSDVLDLDNNNFDTELAKHDIILVEFFAPWCGHCKKLAPHYETAATALKQADPPVALAKVDCVAEESKEPCNRFNVGGFPTLKIFRRGDTANPEDYNGPRESDGIVKFMKSRSGASSKELKNLEDLTSLKENSKETIVFGFFANADSTLAKEFQKTADALREVFKFAHSYNADVNKAAGVTTDEVIVYRAKVYHTKLEDSEVKLGDSSAKTAKIQSFVKSNFGGLASHVTPDTIKFVNKPTAVVYYQLDYVRNAKGSNYWRNRVIKVAKKFEKLSFAVASKGDFQGLVEEVGFNANSEDVNVIIFDEKDRKFRMDPATAFSMDTFESFINEFLSGKLEPYLKSEDVPADNTGPVKTVVAKNFEEIVNDPERDVLIEFYAPWCGHCKSLEPKYKELGEKLSGHDSVTIAKMDATANDVPPQYTVKGFPTIYWAPKGSKSSPKKYEGGREVKDFLAYIKKEATDKNVKDEL